MLDEPPAVRLNPLLYPIISGRPVKPIALFSHTISKTCIDIIVIILTLTKGAKSYSEFNETFTLIIHDL